MFSPRITNVNILFLSLNNIQQVAAKTLQGNTLLSDLIKMCMSFCIIEKYSIEFIIAKETYSIE